MLVGMPVPHRSSSLVNCGPALNSTVASTGARGGPVTQGSMRSYWKCVCTNTVGMNKGDAR